MNKRCPYIVKYKRNDALGIIYKCTLADLLLRSKHLREHWACKGCSIPYIMDNEPCKYLKPNKSFIIRGSSITWFYCDLFGISLNDPMDFCKFHCNAYERLDITQNT